MTSVQLLKNGLLRQNAVYYTRRNYQLTMNNAKMSNSEQLKLKSVEDIPGPEKLPIVGNVLDYLKHEKKQHLWFQELQQKYGDIIKLDMGSFVGNLVYLFNPEYTKAMCAADGSMPDNESAILIHEAVKRLKETKANEDKYKTIFVNRSLNLNMINFCGFDMDYTLATYKSPEYEKLAFQLAKERMVDIGYPASIMDIPYDSSHPARNLWFDYQRGNLLKVDGYGKILYCQHGFKEYNELEILEVYPYDFIKLEEKRTYVYDTLFNLPEIYLLAGLVDYFEKHEDYTETSYGFISSDQEVTYKNIFLDLKESFTKMHQSGAIHEATCKDLSKYIRKDCRLPHVLDNMRIAGTKTFILTNSGWRYTDKVMEYLLGKRWQSYFDYVFVDAQKPRFFGEGTVLRKVDTNTGKLKIRGGLSENETKLFSGGNLEDLERIIKSKGEEVLYIGDHIFSDIIKSKKQAGWKTFLIVPELNDELEMEFGRSGSLFRAGSRQTFFARQVDRFADIYSGSPLNLIYYSPSYMFRAPSMLLPHELN